MKKKNKQQTYKNKKKTAPKDKEKNGETCKIRMK
jgi:hypothetical protein